jgi:hypothetical protein
MSGVKIDSVKIAGPLIALQSLASEAGLPSLLGEYTKHTSKVPLAEIKKAKKYRADYLNRYDEATLRREYDENI